MRRALVLTALSLAACATPASLSDSVPVELGDFFIGPETRSVAAGEVRFQVFNSGEFPHTLVVARQSGAVVFASEVLAPGQSLDIGLELDPDEYQLTCRIVVQFPDGELVDHYQRGMGEAIKVEAGS